MCCFVDFNHGIREECLKFSVLTRITGESIVACVLKDLGLDDANCRGQGYDGASNMSSAHVGLQALAVHTHCIGHCLNLVIGSSCSLPVVRNAIEKMKAACSFFLIVQRGISC